jgi:hypothetical protein
MACNPAKENRRFGSEHRLRIQRLLRSPIGSLGISGTANENLSDLWVFS